MGANDRSLSTPLLGSGRYHLQKLGQDYGTHREKFVSLTIELYPFHSGFISSPYSLQREPDMQIGTKT